MIEVSAVVGGLDVVASGVLHISSDSINAKVNGMDLQIKFLTDAAESVTKYYTEVQGSTLVLNLQNFFSAFPEGQFEPTTIGIVRGRDLLMAFSVVTLNKEKEARIFTYTFYLGSPRP